MFIKRKQNCLLYLIMSKFEYDKRFYVTTNK